MFGRLAEAMARPATAWATVVVAVLVATAGAVAAVGVAHDDDLLAFLPEGNTDVSDFRAIAERFGSLDVALVGIRDADPFSPEFLASLSEASRRIRALDSVAQVLSLTTLEDVEPTEGGGIKLAALVDPLPTTAAEALAVRSKVMARDHVVGQFVSPEADAVLLVVVGAPGADPKALAHAVRAVAEEHFAADALAFGGAPFISTYIYETTQTDMERLTPWSVLAILLLLVLTFRDLVGTALALMSTGMGIAVALGLMAALNEPFNIVLGSMPIILFAVGSAYAIHILSHFYALEPRHGRDEAMRRTLSGVGPTVLAAGLTTVAGLLSFTAMDIAPLRTFGTYTAVGIFATLVFSLTFVPAVVRLTGLRRRAEATGRFARLLSGVSAFAAHRRVPVGLALLVLAGAAGAFVTQVDSRMDNAAFFAQDSPPDQAERFLRDRFGGSQFVQIRVRADMKEPEVLRELEYLADRLTALDGVTSAVTPGLAVAQANYAMEGVARVPDTREKVALLFGLMTGNVSVEQLVTDERDAGLLTVKLAVDRAEDVERVLEAIEAEVADAVPAAWGAAEPVASSEAARTRLVARVSARLRAVARGFGAPLSEAARASLDGLLAERLAERLKTGGGGASNRAVEAAIQSYLTGEECLVDLPQGDPGMAERVAKAVAALGPEPSEDALVTACAEAAKPLSGGAPDEGFVDDLAFAVETPLEEAWTAAASAAAASDVLESLGLAPPTATALDPTKPERFQRTLAAALVDLGVESVTVPAEAGAEGARPVDLTLSGLPVLHRGLSTSVRANQVASLSVALALVVLILALYFRSLSAGLLASVPTLLTLGLIYGGMGLLGVRLDIGTSMLASLIIGAGVDYAVHLVAAFEPDRRAPGIHPAHGVPGEERPLAARVAALRTAPAIWTNAVMVAAGFFVLTLGDAKPLQNVGALTAAAMLAAGAATFLAVPVLARRTAYAPPEQLAAWAHHADDGGVTTAESLTPTSGAPLTGAV